MCCASAKSLLRLVLIGGLVLFGGSARLMAEEAPAKADAEAASTSEAGQEGHPEDHGAGHGHPSGVPLAWKADLALFSLITFVLFIVVLGKFAWGPMIQGLDKRELGIQKAIDDAEEGRRKAHAMLAEYEQKLKAAEQTVQAMVAEARRDAERTSQDLIANAQREVGLIRDRAKDDIRQATDTALAEVFTQINSQVVLATEHVLGRALDEADQDRLVSQALAEISR
jgi:F-type H+-transporting ATPase subunit b